MPDSAIESGEVTPDKIEMKNHQHHECFETERHKITPVLCRGSESLMSGSTIELRDAFFGSDFADVLRSPAHAVARGHSMRRSPRHRQKLQSRSSLPERQRAPAVEGENGSVGDMRTEPRFSKKPEARAGFGIAAREDIRL